MDAKGLLLCTGHAGVVGSPRPMGASLDGVGVGLGWGYGRLVGVVVDPRFGVRVW